MGKEILIEYSDLQEETKDLQRRIRKTEDQIQKMIHSSEQVADTVKGTRPDGTYGPIKVEGFHSKLYERRKKALKKYKSKLEIKTTELLELLNDAEQYIESIEDSEIRNIFRYRFVDDLSLKEIGQRTGYDYSTISKKVSDYFAIEKDSNKSNF